MLRKTSVILLLAGGYLLPLSRGTPVWPAIPLWAGIFLLAGLVLTRSSGLPFAHSGQEAATHGSVLLAAAISMILPVVEWRVRGFAGAIVPSIGQILGFSIAVAGLGLRLYCLRHRSGSLGDTWTPAGPYRVLRYPEHSGGLLVVIGHALAYASLLSAAAAATLMLLTYTQYIRTREGELDTLYGRAFALYRSRTYRLVPRVW